MRPAPDGIRPDEQQFLGGVSERDLGTALIVVVALGLALVPLLVAGLLLGLMRALGLRTRWLLVGAGAGGLGLLGLGAGERARDYLEAGLAWRLPGALEQSGVVATLGQLAPVALPGGALLGVGLAAWWDFRRPMWVTRKPPRSIFSRARDRARRRALAAGRLDEPGVPLGIDQAGQVVVLSPSEIGEHTLVVGATGVGKTHTLLQIMRALSGQGWGLVVIDLKGDRGLVDQLAGLARAQGRTFRLWSFDGPSQWNPLVHGNETELLDKALALHEFSEPYYEQAARYHLLQILAVLRHVGAEIDINALRRYLVVTEFQNLVAATADYPRRDDLLAYLRGLDRGQRSAIGGLHGRLALVAETQGGRYMQASGEQGIDLERSLAEGEIVLFSLDSQAYTQTAGQVGAMALVDLRTVASRRGVAQAAGESRCPVAVVVDEFSALDSDVVLALLARARSVGMGVVVSTQELADLTRVDEGFADQVIGNTATKIVHRQDVPESAERLAGLAGTEAGYEETFQTDRDRISSVAGKVFGGWTGQTTGRGTIREVESYLVHPNDLKRLGRGEAVVIRKSPAFAVHRLTIANAPLGARETAPARIEASTDRHPMAPAPAARARPAATGVSSPPGAPVAAGLASSSGAPGPAARGSGTRVESTDGATPAEPDPAGQSSPTPPDQGIQQPLVARDRWSPYFAEGAQVQRGEYTEPAQSQAGSADRPESRSGQLGQDSGPAIRRPLALAATTRQPPLDTAGARRALGAWLADSDPGLPLSARRGGGDPWDGERARLVDDY